MAWTALTPTTLTWNETAAGNLPSAVVATPAILNLTGVRVPTGTVGDGVADDTTALKNAYAACSAGETLLLPPGTYKITSPLVMSKYVALAGFAGVGAATATPLIRSVGTDALQVQFGYNLIRDLQLSLSGATRGVTPGSAYGNCGIRLNTTGHPVQLRLDNVQIWNYDTGICTQGDGVYLRGDNLTLVQNTINLGIDGLGGTWSSFNQCHILDAYQHGLYGKGYGVFNGCLFENNGDQGNMDTSSGTFDGIKLASGEWHFERCWLDDQTYVGEGASAFIGPYIHETNFRLFGPGNIINTNQNTSANLLPPNITTQWTPASGSTWADDTYHNSIGTASGTAVQALYNITTPLQHSITFQDMDSISVACDVKVSSGTAAPGFAFAPDILLTQQGPGTDSNSAGLDYRRSEYSTLFNDGNWHRVNYLWHPRYGASYLSSGDSTAFRIQVQLNFTATGAGFGSSTLSAHVRNPELRIHGTRMIY